MSKLALFLLSILLISCTTDSPQVDGTPQNVLVILCDDLAIHALGCYGNTSISTPHIDRLASEGHLYRNAYTNVPMCTPSRASLLTGRFAHATGVTLLRTALPDSMLTLSEHLSSHGFATGIFGKNHFNSSLTHGFDVIKTRSDHKEYLARATQMRPPEHVRIRPPWKPFRDPARVWLNADQASSGNSLPLSEAYFFTEQVLAFLERNREQRSFVMLNYHEPHSPFNFPWEFQDTFSKERIDLPGYGAEDDRYIPAIFRDLEQDDRKGIVASYYQSVMYIDACVGHLLDKMKERRLLEETMIVFTSDHGYLLNHHGRFEKHMMWEEALRIPFIVHGYHDLDTNRTAQLIDLCPTITRALDVPNLEGHGRALQDPRDPDETVFAEYLTDHKYMMLESNRWKYIYSSGIRDLGSGYATGKGPIGVQHRLYDLQNDPHEQADVAGKHPAIKQRLQELLLQQLKQTHPLRTRVSDDMSIEEQLLILAMPPEGEDVGSY